MGRNRMSECLEVHRAVGFFTGIAEFRTALLRLFSRRELQRFLFDRFSEANETYPKIAITRTIKKRANRYPENSTHARDGYRSQTVLCRARAQQRAERASCLPLA